MSGRDEPPATVPPPAGEDDAYNAATKVGAMPPELVARLREEGLLPEEDKPAAPPAPASNPASSVAPPRPVPRPAARPVPIVHSSAPPKPGGATSAPSGRPTPTPPAISVLPPLDASGVPRIQIDSPIDGIRTTSSAPPEGETASEPPEPMPSGRPSGSAGLEAASVPPEGSQPSSKPAAASGALAAPAGGIPARRLGLVFVVVAVLVGVAFLLALLSQRG